MNSTTVHLLWNVGMTLLSPIIAVLRCTCPKRPAEPIPPDQRCSPHAQLNANWDEDRGGYRAARGHYDNVWTRDSFFALLAPIPEQCLRNARLAERLQHDMTPQGHVPFTYNQVFYTPTLLCPCLPRRCRRRDVPQTRYRDEKLGALVMDSNAQYVILVHRVACRTQDPLQRNEWLTHHRESVLRALSWYFPHTDPRTGFVLEEPFGSWEDSLLLYGAVPYTNVLYCYALDCARGMYPDANINLKVPSSRDLASLVFQPGRMDYVSVSMLALYPIKGMDMRRVDEALDALHRGTTSPWVPNRQKHLSDAHVMLALTILGQGQYHNGWRWAWVGCLFAAALASRKKISAARQRLRPYMRLFEQYGTLHEVYDANGDPVARAFYSSEPYFSEALGCFLLAVQKTGLSL